MPRKGQKQLPKIIGDPSDPHGFAALSSAFFEWMRVKNYSERTVENRQHYLERFTVWCIERGITQPAEVTKALLERYQRHLYHYRKENGQPLTFGSQFTHLVPVRAFFKWCARQNHTLYNPAGELEMPRLEKRLPKHVLTASESDRVLNQANVTDPLGLRDRAILETFYSTGMRRRELSGLKLYDLDIERGTVMVRQGKGKKDRMIPIGSRALAWIDKYVLEVRPTLTHQPDDGTLFLSNQGDTFSPNRLTQMVRRVCGRCAARQERRVPSVPPHDGNADAGERRRHSIHPGDARPRGVIDHANLHASQHPQAERDPFADAPRAIGKAAGHNAGSATR